MKSIFLALVIVAFSVLPSTGVVNAGSGDDPVAIGLPPPDEETSDDDEDDAEESDEGGQGEESGSQGDEGEDEGEGQPSRY